MWWLRYQVACSNRRVTIASHVEAASQKTGNPPGSGNALVVVDLGSSQVEATRKLAGNWVASAGCDCEAHPSCASMGSKEQIREAQY